MPALAGPLFAQTSAPPLPLPDDSAYWDKTRDQFLLARDKVFFNTGTIGAMPRVVFERTVEHPRQNGATAVRHCTHIYNSTTEIDQALKVLRAV